MAKELPYFQFEPGEWENGNIQMCTREEKGLFIDLCAMYWARLGNLPFKLALQKLCDGNATALNSLCENKIIAQIDGNIYIKFLSEQLEEREYLSKKNSKIAKDAWLKRNSTKESNAVASISQSEVNTNAMPIEEKRIEENRREEKKENENTKSPAAPVFNFKKSLIDYGFKKDLVDEWLLIRKKKRLVNTENAFKAHIREVEANGRDKNVILTKCLEKSWGGFESSYWPNTNNSNNKNLVKINFPLTKKEVKEIDKLTPEEEKELTKKFRAENFTQAFENIDKIGVFTMDEVDREDFFRYFLEAKAFEVSKEDVEKYNKEAIDFYTNEWNKNPKENKKLLEEMKRYNPSEKNDSKAARFIKRFSCASFFKDWIMIQKNNGKKADELLKFIL